MEVVSSLSELVEMCKAAFVKEFGLQPSVGAKAPGRVNIIGEHTDYNDGFVFPMVSQLTYAILKFLGFCLLYCLDQEGKMVRIRRCCALVLDCEQTEENRYTKM